MRRQLLQYEEELSYRNHPWDAYKLQFEVLYFVNCWSSAQKATYLAVSLQGPALTVLNNISDDHCGDYMSSLLP